MSGRKVLVTGGAGFIGGRLVEMLTAQGDEVVVFDDLSTGRRERVAPGARLVVGDVRDAGALRAALDDVSVVFHLAARVTIRASVAGFRQDHDVNLGGTLALLEALEGTDVTRLVNASSMAVYADSEPGVRVSEDHPRVPLSPYGISKLAAEHYVRVRAGALGIEQVSLRFFNTWGPGQALSPYVGVMTIFINALLAGRRPTIFGDGSQARDFIHVDDVARAAISAGAARLASPSINIGTGVATTVTGLLGLIAGAIGVDSAADHAPARLEELRCSVADPTRAQAELGFAARVPLDAAPLVSHWRNQGASS